MLSQRGDSGQVKGRSSHFWWRIRVEPKVRGWSRKCVGGDSIEGKPSEPKVRAWSETSLL